MSVWTPVTWPSSVSRRVTSPLLHPEVFLGLQGVLHDLLVFPPVGLGPQGVDRRPLARLSTRYWMQAASAARPSRPPRASSSRTRWPLPVPPMAGLQGMLPTASRLMVKHRGGQPQPGAGQGGLNPRVAGAHHDHLVGAGLVGREVL